jgi:Dolichyl-phosphate-mannose-protein mannosyltransferase
MTTTGAVDHAPHDDPSPDHEVRLATRWIALAAASASLMTLAVTRITHAAVGTDAVAYLAIADNIEAGRGASLWLEDPLLTWPPLWPGLLAAVMKVTGLRGDVAAVLVNAVVVAGCVVLGLAVARRVLRSTRALAVLAAALAISPLLAGLAAFVQTEAIFALISLGILWAIMRAGEATTSIAPRWLVLAGLLTAVGFYIRYQALYVVPVFAGWLVLSTWTRERAPLRALANGAWYAVPAVGLSAIWIARNLSLSDDALGPRFPSDLGPADNTAGALRTIFKFVTSIPTAPLLPSAAFTLVAAVVALVVLVRVTRPAGGSPTFPARLTTAFGSWAGLLSTFVGGFTLLMVVSRSLVGFDDLDIRLLAPLMVPTWILFLRYVEIVTLERPSTRVQTFGKVVLGLWLVPQVVMMLALIGPANGIVADFGYNADRAVAASHSPALDALPDGCTSYSNNAADLYRSGFQAELSPRTVEYKSSQRTRQLEDLTARVEDGELACLVWVEYTEDEENYSPEQMAERMRLERLASADGITVYRFEPLS